MRQTLIAMALVTAGTAAAAQPVGQMQAERQLPPTRGLALALSNQLSEQERAVVRAMVREADRTQQSFRYHGSIAYSPSEGLTSESLQGAFNFHSVQAADRAALAACNAARKRGSARCQVAAQVLPQGYRPGGPQLSYDATAAFRSTYRSIPGEKALAVSERTGAWRIARGGNAAAAAVAACNQVARDRGGRADCVAVVAD